MEKSGITIGKSEEECWLVLNVERCTISHLIRNIKQNMVSIPITSVSQIEKLLELMYSTYRNIN